MCYCNIVVSYSIHNHNLSAHENQEFFQQFFYVENTDLSDKIFQFRKTSDIEPWHTLGINDFLGLVKCLDKGFKICNLYIKDFKVQDYSFTVMLGQTTVSRVLLACFNKQNVQKNQV